MADYFHILKNQVAKYLKGVDISVTPWKDFLKSVSETYEAYDEDKSTMEHLLNQSAEEVVKANEEMHAVFQAIPDQLFHLNNEGRIISYKSGKNDHYYLTEKRLIGRQMQEVTSREIAQKFAESIDAVIQKSVAIHFEFVIVHDKKIYYYEVRMLPLQDHEVFALVRDITERKLADEQIAYLAYHDSLTGLPNNRLFKDRLQQGIAHAQRNESRLAIMFLDLDRFKLINDTMGHSIGDQLLQAIADRLMDGIRRTDSVAMNHNAAFNSSVARLGGDEFTIMLEDVESIQAVIRVADRIIKLVRESLMLDNQKVYTSTSIGIAVYPDDGEDAETLLRNADAAMYHAKDQGRNNFQFFTEAMNRAAVEKLVLENNLRKALEINELCLYYQPQIDVISGKTIGMEALLRWEHPEKGFISPVDFIPVAEETGLIKEIGEWVIKEACRQGAKWHEENYVPFRISVNLSAKQLKEEGLADYIDSTLKETGMNPRYLGIELTESAIILEPEMALERLKKIKSSGIRLSLDDFGTGYSSLSYLKRFPIDTLKIDQAFIHDVNIDHEDAALVKAIIVMAHGLGMDVIAEGVETQEQYDFLSAHACDGIQGYFFSRPLPADEIETRLMKLPI